MQYFYSDIDKSPLNVTRGDFTSLNKYALFVDWKSLYFNSILIKSIEVYFFYIIFTVKYPWSCIWPGIYQVILTKKVRGFI